MVVASVGRPFGQPWADPSQLDKLKGPMSPRGGLLRTWLIVASCREGSCVLALESSWHDNAAVAVYPLSSGATASNEELL